MIKVRIIERNLFSKFSLFFKTSMRYKNVLKLCCYLHPHLCSVRKWGYLDKYVYYHCYHYESTIEGTYLSRAVCHSIEITDLSLKFFNIGGSGDKVKSHNVTKQEDKIIFLVFFSRFWWLDFFKDKLIKVILLLSFNPNLDLLW